MTPRQNPVFHRRGVLSACISARRRGVLSPRQETVRRREGMLSLRCLQLCQKCAESPVIPPAAVVYVHLGRFCHVVPGSSHKDYSADNPLTVLWPYLKIVTLISRRFFRQALLERHP